MLYHFNVICFAVAKRGGTISFEWPRYCSGWNLPELKAIISRYKLVVADVDGCQVGVVAKSSNTPILRPWRFVSNNSDLVGELGKLRCAKVHEHAPCAGADTVQTGFYTKMLADIMVDYVFRKYVCYCCVSPAPERKPRVQSPNGPSIGSY